MTSVVSVINLTGGEVEKTHPIPATPEEYMIRGTNQHIILLVDKNTSIGLIFQNIERFKPYAISTKCVTSSFTRQFFVSYKDWTND